MADRNRRLPENADGLFFVDSSCFNCGLSRQYAPSIFGDTGEHAFVKQQPANGDDLLATKQALLVCPMGSIGTAEKTDLADAVASFPIELVDDIFLTGFNSADSFGADSYFIRSDSGNWLIDSPRYARHLVDRFEEMGGIDYIFLTHRDDVADAHKYAKRFSAQRIINEQELEAQPDAEIVLSGGTPLAMDKATIIFAPGHTEGHMVLLWEGRYLFTGDHLAWIPEIDGLGSFDRFCWYSWEEQIRSVASLAEFSDVEWVLPGHGRRKQIDAGKFPQLINEAVAWMQTRTAQN